VQDHKPAVFLLKNMIGVVGALAGFFLVLLAGRIKSAPFIAAAKHIHQLGHGGVDDIGHDRDNDLAATFALGSKGFPKVKVLGTHTVLRQGGVVDPDCAVQISRQYRGQLHIGHGFFFGHGIGQGHQGSPGSVFLVRSKHFMLLIIVADGVNFA